MKRIFTSAMLSLTVLFAAAQQGQNSIGDAKPSNHVNSSEQFSSANPLKDGSVQAFAWAIFVGPGAAAGAEGKGPMHITLPEGVYEQIELVNESIYGGDFVGDKVYAVKYIVDQAFPLVKIDPETGTVELIGGGITDGRGLAYDVTTKTMYAINVNGQLYTINLETGEPTLIGGALENTTGIACTETGELYAISIDTDQLHKINKGTGEATVVGNLGLDIKYKQEIAYDRDNKVMYGGLSTQADDGLFTIDITTGEATLIAWTSVELGTLAIPYTNTGTGIENPQINVGVYPNPSTGIFNVAVEGTVCLSVADITGRVVHSQILNGNGEVNLSDQANGLYILMISSPEGLVAKKILKK